MTILTGLFRSQHDGITTDSEAEQQSSNHKISPIDSLQPNPSTEGLPPEDSDLAPEDDNLPPNDKVGEEHDKSQLR